MHGTEPLSFCISKGINRLLMRNIGPKNKLQYVENHFDDDNNWHKVVVVVVVVVSLRIISSLY